MFKSSYSLAVCMFAIVFLGLGVGCSSTTTVSTVWKSPDPFPAHFSKVLALVVNASPGERRAGEDELVRSFRTVKGVAAYTLVPDDDLKDKARILADIEGQDFDAAAVIRLVSLDKRNVYVTPQYGPSYDPFSTSYRYESYRPGYQYTEMTFTAEASLYSVKDQKLLWAGSCTIEDPKNIQDLVAQVSRGVVEEMKRQGLIQ